ncbi:MAG: glycosyltransferase family 39 protein [Candidatus Aminicenantes bacterium]|nr:glycosyltransferase family 39 protein [Candidatus Aminicenantes bacterium]
MTRTKLYLALIFVGAAVLNILDIGWGLPNRERIYSYKGDEHTFLIRLNRLNPGQFDFDPDYYWKPHLNVYYTGAVLKAGQLLGIYKIGDREYYKKYPREFRKVILWQRIFWGKIPLLFLVWISFLIGKLIKSEKFGLAFAAVTGILPTFLVNGNYGVENIVIPLLSALVFFFSLKYHRSGAWRDIILAGVVCGLAASTKQSGLLSFVFILGAVFTRRKTVPKARLWGHLAAAGIFACLSFSLTSPFYMKFLVLKVFSPALVKPDLHGSTSLPMDIFHREGGSVFPGIWRLLRIHFVQLGGVIFLCVPFGIFSNRKDPRVRWAVWYVLVFFGISLFVLYSTDSRLTPLAYVLSFLGILGLFFFLEKPLSPWLKRGIVVVAAVSLLSYAIAIEVFFLKPGTREISSRWIEKQLLSRGKISLGLHEDPGYAHPDVLTREWRHFTPGNEKYYPNDYQERFIIPDFELRELGVPDVLPQKNLETRAMKQRWLESQAPEYIILTHDLLDWPEYFLHSPHYTLVKHFRPFGWLGINQLSLVKPEVYVFKRRKALE